MCYDMSSTDKLSIFADDMRRMGVPMLPPCINGSLADFSVEADGEETLGVRYALGALKGVGEGAMEQLCAERADRGVFASLDDFADRIGARLLNRRQLESLAAGGAFDRMEPNRAGVHAVAETILAVASEAEHARSSGQGGLFGGEEHKVAAVKLPPHAHWSMAERMAQEKDAFGFYFSAHPIDRYRHLAGAHGARSYAEICAQPSAGDGGRVGAVMAVLVEDVRWRTSARGRRYINSGMSDASGQFIASCFDEDVAKMLEEAARAGSCVLLTVELDRQAGEETPRITVRRAQRFEALAATARMKAEIIVSDASAVAALAALLAGERGGRGEVVLRVPLDGARTAEVLLGKDYALDEELAGQIEAIGGVDKVSLINLTPKLALVS
jgi:DNA polymerase-3 subunit alpha